MAIFIKPPILFFACLIVAGMLQIFHPVEIASYPFAAGLTVAAVLTCSAVAIGGWAIREMKGHGTPLEPGSVPLRLVRSGPFRFTRNPLYLAQLLVLTAIALAVNSIWFLGAVPVLLLLLDRLIVVREERVIRETFGTEYANYVKAVRRWI